MRLDKLYRWRNYMGFGIVQIFIAPAAIYMAVHAETMNAIEAFAIIGICATAGSIIARITINEIFK